jgi:hypothetical protein
MARPVNQDREKREAMMLSWSKKKVKRNYPVGAHVRLHPMYRSDPAFKRYRDLIGVVVGVQWDFYPKIQWPNRKTADSYHPVFFRRIRKIKPMNRADYEVSAVC